MTILYNLYSVSLLFDQGSLCHSLAGTTPKLCRVDRSFLWGLNRFKHMPLKLSLGGKKLGKNKTNLWVWGFLHAMNSTLSLKAEFFQNLKVTNRALCSSPAVLKEQFQDKQPGGAPSWPWARLPNKPKTVPRNLPRRLKCWQAREQKDRAVNTNLQLRVRNQPTHISQPIHHSLSLSSQQSKYRFSLFF